MTEVSNRVWTVPNAISMFRLALVPVFAVLIFAERDVAAVIVLVVAGATDWLDGVIARRFDQMTRLGQMLDPVADRLYIFVTLIGLAYREFIPWWLVAIIVARELVLVALLPFLGARRLAPLEVNFVGKAATFALMYSFPLLLLAHGDGTLAAVAYAVGWAAALWGVALYLLSAAIYVAQVVGAYRRLPS